MLARMMDAARMPDRYDLLIEAGTVLPMTAGHPVLRDGAVAVSGGRLAYVGPAAALPPRPTARRLSAPGGVLCPGLLNLHAHLPHSLLLALGDGLSVQDWLEGLIFPIERSAVDVEFVRTGTELGLLQMLAAGVTLSVDMYYFEAEMAAVVDRVGARAVLGQTVIGLPAPDAAGPEEGLRRAERFLLEWAGHGRVEPAVAPHAVYTTGPDVLCATRDLCARHGARCLIHLSEAHHEIASVSARHGKSPIALVEDLGLLTVPTVAAHVIYPQPGDLQILQRRQVAVAHCPQSNLHMGEDVAPVREYLRAGVPVGLGSDGAGSAPGVDLCAEAALCGHLMKLRAGRADGASARELLHLLTAGAAAALGRADLGSLAPGQPADLVLFEPAGPVPDPLLADPYAFVIYAGPQRRVALTLVEGKVLYERGAFPTVDLDDLGARVRAQIERMRAALRQQ